MLACVVAIVRAEPEPVDAVSRSDMWQQRLESLVFVSIEGRYGLFPSLEKFRDGRQVRVIFDQRDRDKVVYEYVSRGLVLVSVVGNRESSFAAAENILFFAEYEPDVSGCTVVAYDLSSGRQLWRTKLHHKQPSGASAYRNRVSVSIPDSRVFADKDNQHAVIVNGSESYCDYIEVLDAKTGEMLAIKNYRVGFGPLSSEDPPVSGPTGDATPTGDSK